MLPTWDAELFAEKEEKKERNEDNRGLLYDVDAMFFFLIEADESEDWEASDPERGRDATAPEEGPAERSEMSCRP